MLPAAVALGGQAAAGLIGEAGRAIASAVDPAAIAYRKQMKKDVDAMRRGKLGLSEAEKRTMLAGTQRALQAQTAGAEANLRRSAAAMGGFGRSGAQQAALGQMGAAQREELAGAAGRVDALSQDVAQRRFESVMGRLASKRKEAMDTGARIGAGVQGYFADTEAERIRQRDKALGEGAAETAAPGAAAKTYARGAVVR
jgi:hypothetical protein